MKAVFAIATLLASASAAVTANPPSKDCAKSCITDAIKQATSSCKGADVKCICGVIEDTAVPCAVTACGGDQSAVQKIQAIVDSVCKGVSGA